MILRIFISGFAYLFIVKTSNAFVKPLPIAPPRKDATILD